jgi:hypothetical protein
MAGAGAEAQGDTEGVNGGEGALLDITNIRRRMLVLSAEEMMFTDYVMLFSMLYS